MYFGAEHLMGFLMFVPSAQWYSYLGRDNVAFSTSESFLMGLQGCSSCSHTLPMPCPESPSPAPHPASPLQSCSIASCRPSQTSATLPQQLATLHICSSCQPHTSDPSNLGNFFTFENTLTKFCTAENQTRLALTRDPKLWLFYRHE